jgi:hypothetical protein
MKHSGLYKNTAGTIYEVQKISLNICFSIVWSFLGFSQIAELFMWEEFGSPATKLGCEDLDTQWAWQAYNIANYK